MKLQDLKKLIKYFRITGVLTLLIFILISSIDETCDFKNYFLYLSVFCFLLPLAINIFLYLLKEYFK